MQLPDHSSLKGHDMRECGLSPLHLNDVGMNQQLHQRLVP